MPYGAARRKGPDLLSGKTGSFAPNEVIASDGWVHGSVAYPNNAPPLNNDVWFHLADNSGWVPFAATRELPTSEDPTGFSADLGPLSPTPAKCEGVAH